LTRYVLRSLIASYIGNIIGALFVALPATYFYLGDYEAGGMRKAENGERRVEDSREGSEDNVTDSKH